MPATVNVSPAQDLKSRFMQLAEKWRDETEESSVLALRYIHPAYLRIIGLGPVVVPWILDELKVNPDWWFEALKALTGEDPTQPNASFDDAVKAWLNWGRKNYSNA
jgi:hypothetical protein